MWPCTFQIKRGCPQSKVTYKPQKIFHILKKADSRLWVFVKKSMLENSGESAARKVRVRDIIVSCKLIPSFLFLGFRLGLSQGTLYKLIGTFIN